VTDPLKCLLCDQPFVEGRVLGFSEQAKDFWRTKMGSEIDENSVALCSRCQALEGDAMRRQAMAAMSRVLLEMSKDLGMTFEQHIDILKRLPVFSPDDRALLIELTRKKP
jgi:GTP1/Obg family GTP-binding protein